VTLQTERSQQQAAVYQTHWEDRQDTCAGRTVPHNDRPLDAGYRHRQGSQRWRSCTGDRVKVTPG